MQAFCWTDYSKWWPELIEKVEEREDEQMNRHFSGCLEPVTVTTAALFLRKVFRRSKQGFWVSSSAPALACLPGKQLQPRFNPACLNKIRSVSSMEAWVEQQRVRQCGSKGPAIQTEFRLVKYSFSRIITGSCWSRRLKTSRALGQLVFSLSVVRYLRGHYVKMSCCYWCNKQLNSQ